jgi:hypothetical protein
MGIAEDVVRELLEAEQRGSSTSRTAKDIVRLILRHFKARLLVEIDTVRMSPTTIDLGSFHGLDQYRKAVGRAKDHMEQFLHRLERETEEGL